MSGNVAFAMGDLVVPLTRKTYSVVFQVTYTDASGRCDAISSLVGDSQYLITGFKPEDLLKVACKRKRDAMEGQFPTAVRYSSKNLVPSDVVWGAGEPFAGDLVTLFTDDPFEEHFVVAWVDAQKEVCNLITKAGPGQRLILGVPVAHIEPCPKGKADLIEDKFPTVFSALYSDGRAKLPEHFADLIKYELKSRRY
jgi:hypothetical protein